MQAGGQAGIAFSVVVLVRLAILLLYMVHAAYEEMCKRTHPTPTAYRGTCKGTHPTLAARHILGSRSVTGQLALDIECSPAGLAECTQHD